ncbi:MAG: pyridoxal-dependent decarboxylase, partial [Acidimicrobiia bacterium]|nr:pyridoxal-dependent decarboxylase [Acidimicrobiia bacterium]
LGISWESSPALTEVEEVVCDWLRQAVGLSSNWSSTFHDTASTSCLVALIVARERASNNSYAGPGLAAADRAPVVYCTGQAHSSVRKAALLAGFGADQVRIIDHDPETFAMDTVDLETRIAADRTAGLIPAAVVATVGTTGTTAIDPVSDIVAVGGDSGLWVHVDAAMAGSAMILPECRPLWHGVEGADSITWNPHKWLGTVLDTSLFHIRDVDLLIQVMSTNPTYLWSKADGEVTQFRDWGIPLGRRFRALKVLFQLRIDGIEALQTRLRRDLSNAQWLAAQVEATPGWEVVAPVPLQTVCVVHTPEDAHGSAAFSVEELNVHTRSWVDAINTSGQAYLTPTLLDDRWIARVSIGVETTERHHVERLWELMQAAADEAAKSSVRSG